MHRALVLLAVVTKQAASTAPAPELVSAWIPFLALIGTIVGGAIAILGSLISEWYKRRLDARSAASALAAEIWSLVEHAKQHKLIDTLRIMEANLAGGVDQKFPKLFMIEPSYGIIFERSIDKMGMFPADLTDQVVMAYGSLVAFRATFKNLIDGVWDDQENALTKKRTQIIALIGLLEKGEKFQEELVPRLRHFARRTAAR